jgi:hypothetical protein
MPVITTRLAIYNIGIYAFKKLLQSYYFFIEMAKFRAKYLFVSRKSNNFAADKAKIRELCQCRMHTFTVITFTLQAIVKRLAVSKI